jgi:DNA-binding NarL/FixJ family response regulator
MSNHLAVAAPPALRVSELPSAGSHVLIFSYPMHATLCLDALTDSETAVVVLAAAGISNKSIAAVRRTSVRTVANQLASAYRKLGGACRTCLNPGPTAGGRA